MNSYDFLKAMNDIDVDMIKAAENQSVNHLMSLSGL